MITITFDETLIEQQMQRLQKIPYAVQRALFPAVSETLRLARTDLTRQLVSDVPLPPRLLEKSVKLSQAIARGTGVEGSLTVIGKAMPLIFYSVTPKEITARKGLRSKRWPGFTYSLRSGEARERERLGSINQITGLPFIAQMRNSTGKRRNGVNYAQQSGSGHLGVYYQTSNKQIKEAYGPTVQYHATTPEIEQMLVAGADENFSRTLPRIIDRVLAEGKSV